MTDLERIKNHYELILNSAGEGIYGLDKEGKGTFTNRAAELMTGWKADDLIGQSVHDLHHHSFADGSIYPKQQCPIYHALKDGEVHHVTNEVFWRKDGTSFPVHYTSTPIREQGQITGAVVVFQDVSRLKQTEQALSQLQHRNQLILASAGEGICGFDCKGQVSFINPTARKLLAWHDEQLNDQTIQDIFGKGLPDPKESCPVHNILQGKDVFEDNDTVFWRRDGQPLPVEFISTPISENEQLTGVVVIFRDISERKLAEEKLNQAFEEIGQLKNKLQQENSYLKEQANLNHNFVDIIGQSPALHQVLSQVEQVAPTDTTVLIQGETGTGKELIARALHNFSPRKDSPLVKVNCAALPGNLIESELFGHEKGSFTGATAKRIGRFELADGGSIFLDEIGELSLELQAKLLRVLQEGEIERLGDSRTIPVNARVIAATHRNLLKMVHNGEFREDLYYRLNVFPLNLPPLRERKQDISQLVYKFLEKYSIRTGKQINHISENEMNNLKAYHWPGNVRELENIIERAVILTSTPNLKIPQLNFLSNEQNIEKPLLTMAAMERQHIIDVLQQTQWQVSGENGAAVILEMHPNTLRSRMSKLGIRRSIMIDS